VRRLHLIELEDQPWLPGFLRDFATDYLQHVLAVGKPYAPAAERLAAALRAAGSDEVLDLCSGGAGPWAWMRPLLTERGADVTVRLSDLYPNLTAFRKAEQDGKGRLLFVPDPVDATAVPADQPGFRTLFTAFHHFRPEAAQAILADAVRSRRGIAVFEVTQRSAKALLLTALSPLFVLLVTPFIRPFRLSRLLFTYLLPVVPLVVVWDGIVSCLRTYTAEELRAMVEALGETGYQWEIGEVAGVTFLIGRPLAAP
jgi:hypothetical protein